MKWFVRSEASMEERRGKRRERKCFSRTFVGA
jgi:hypothetical protein